MAVIDCREAVAAELRAGLERSGLEHFADWSVPSVLGRRSVKAVRDRPQWAEGRVTPRRRIACDLLCVSGGWSPTCISTPKLAPSPSSTRPRGAFCQERRGRPKGLPEAPTALSTSNLRSPRGQPAAGMRQAAYGACPPLVDDIAQDDPAYPDGDRAVAQPGPSERSGKRFVDLQEDVTDRDVALAVREGYRSVEHVKRYTTLGMGTDQGKTSNTTGFALSPERCGGASPKAARRPSARPMCRSRSARSPARMAGDISVRKDARRCMNGMSAAGAVMMQSGPWLRPQCYPRPGESLERRRKARSARGSPGRRYRRRVDARQVRAVRERRRRVPRARLRQSLGRRCRSAAAAMG